MLTEYMVTDAVVGDPQDSFFDGLEAALERLGEKGMQFEVAERDEKDTHVRVSWLDHLSGAAIRMWDDHVDSVRYLELRAPEAGKMSVLRSILAEELHPPARAELLERARAAEAKPPALLRLAYSAGDKPDADIVSVLSAALDSPRVEFRAAAARAAGILGWPELVKRLEARQPLEKDPRVAELLTRSIELWRPK